jgi:outer membrane receptor protein involved in Fe transport
MFAQVSYSQQVKQGRVSVIILTEEGNPLEGATAELLRSKDSAIAKTSITDKAGLAEFQRVASGSYKVRVTMVNSSPYTSEVFAVNNDVITLPSISVKVKAGTNLKDVTVTARKPFIQKLIDRIVVNVDNSIVSAGSTALDILERSPGVTVDQDDAISLRGRAGVIIMIDGKISPMTGADLGNYLRNLPSNAIDRIEIITNPSAKYDAAGNSGIIDIRLKKDQRLGTNGTFTAGYGQGVYPKLNSGLSLNYRNKKVNVFGNYNNAYREAFGNLIVNRNFFENGVFKGSDDKDNFGHFASRSNNIRVGADYFPSKKTTVGIVVNGNINSTNRNAGINTIVNDLNYKPNFTFFTSGKEKNKNKNAVANLNLKHRIDSVGREITADVDFGQFSSSALSRTASSFYRLNGTKFREDDILDGDQQGELTLRTAKVDYVNPLKQQAKLEVGVKSSYVSSDNDAKFFNVYRSRTDVDSGKTNRFFYHEYNHAGYINYSKEYKKFSAQLGLRGEQTNLKTRQVRNDSSFSRDYFALFPSAFFNYKLKENKTVGVSVSRRIDRPGYSSLNPFLTQVDATIYNTGDPNLRPQMTWSYELNYTVKNLNFTFGYSHTTDPQNTVLVKILDVIPNFEIKPGQDSNITVQIPVNLESSDYLGLSATLPVRIKKWWNMINNVNAFYQHFNGNLAGVQLNSGAPAVNIRTNNSFSFKKGWSAELNGNIRSGGRYGYAISQPQGAIDIGAQKIIMKGKGTLRLNVTDILWTNRPRVTVTYEGSYIENWNARRETRVANLNFTYRFGNNKVQAARRRAAASEEEIRRAGGN